MLSEVQTKTPILFSLHACPSSVPMSLVANTKRSLKKTFSVNLNKTVVLSYGIGDSVAQYCALKRVSLKRF